MACIMYSEIFPLKRNGIDRIVNAEFINIGLRQRRLRSAPIAKHPGQLHRYHCRMIIQNERQSLANHDEEARRSDGAN